MVAHAQHPADGKIAYLYVLDAAGRLQGPSLPRAGFLFSMLDRPLTGNHISIRGNAAGQRHGAGGY